MSLLLAALLAAQTATGSTVDTYRNPANWLCLPGRNDVCSRPVRTTALNPNGYGSTGQSVAAANPPVDCFYVYPTVSRDSGLNSDRRAGPEETGMTEVQFARFASVCRPFVPIYRQMTLGAVAAAATGADVTQAGMLAFSDVRAAWKEYLATHNKGRPYILIGHSQGSLMLQQLIANDIEGRPEAKRMRLAIIPGFNLLVPQGKLVGGTFKSTPLCARPGQTGCVLSWVTFRERNPPPAGAIFGIADRPGMTVACTNPARPGTAGWAPLDSYWYSRSVLPVPGGPIQWSSEGAPPSPYLRTQGLVSGRCVNSGQRGYFELRTNADPRDKRTDRVGGEVGMLGMFIPGWGMHLADMQATQGDLLRIVEGVSRAK